MHVTDKNFDQFITKCYKYLNKHYPKFSKDVDTKIIIQAIIDGTPLKNNKHVKHLLTLLIKRRKDYTKRPVPYHEYSEADQTTIKRFNDMQRYSDVHIQSVANEYKNHTLNKEIKVFINKADSYLIDDNPMLSKKSRAKIIITGLRQLTSNKSYAETIYYNKSIEYLPSQRNLNQFKKFIKTFSSNPRQQKRYIEKFCNAGQHKLNQHKHIFRAIEYVAIPLIIFALPNIVSDTLTFLTSSFFSLIGSGAMLYGSHFMTIEAIPRLVLSVIGDAIAYGINKKRDEQ